MAMRRCEADEHYYDDSKHSSCPFCGGNRGSEEKTSLMNNRDETDKTKVAYPSGIGSNKTDTTVIAKNKSNTEENKKVNDDNLKTTVNWGNIKNKGKTLSNTETTQKDFSNAPITGWLVIIEGNQTGKDFRLIPSINNIGRDSSNHVSIDTGDSSISREKHCLIEYHVKSKKFYLEKVNNSTDLNGNRVGGDGMELKSGDVIEIGNTKLKFIPFCSDEFSWDI